ncbi:MAG TPA: ABC transporter substrate-binding protein, partial [Candidatus Binatia bacterium]|nr:ABC transporter substrate-binding protein [Candidatus Binatia bacterium]
IKPYVTSHKIPTLLGATVDEIGDGKYIFRVTFPAAAEGFLEGYLAGRAGYKNAVLIAPNYNAGQSAIENFEKGFVAAGGRVVQKLMPRLGTADFGPFINQFPANADVVIAFEPGADGVRFIRQYGDFGKKLPLFGFPSTVDENTLPAEGKAADGFIGAAFYFSTLATQQNQTFVKDWEAAYHTAPGWQAAAGYIAAQILDQAFRSLADPSDKEALVKTIKGVKIVSPAGPLHFDSNNNPIAPRYIMQIRDVNGAEQPVVFATIPLFVPDASAPPLPKNIAFPKAGSASR